MGLHVFPILIPPPTSLSTAPPRFSQCTRSERLSHASNLGSLSSFNPSFIFLFLKNRCNRMQFTYHIIHQCEMYNSFIFTSYLSINK